MSTENAGRILRSSLMIAGSQLINTALNLARTKAAAVLLGPAGIGLIGLLQNVMNSAGLVASLGLNASATRELSAARASPDPGELPAVRRGVEWGGALLAAVAALVVWLARTPIAAGVLGDQRLSDAIGLIAIGVALSVLGSVQTGILTGYQQSANIARTQIWSALLSSVAGVAVLLRWGPDGIIWFVLVSPLATAVVARWYIRKLPRLNAPPSRLSRMAAAFRAAAALGLPIMLGAAAVSFGQLAVRLMVQEQLGVAALGQFQAAWTISITYVTFILNALTADFYPRLSERLAGGGPAGALIAEQQEIALILAAPILMVAVAAAPLVVFLLYSADFAQAAEIFRWQVLGDLIKVALWPLSYALLAAGAGRWYLASELSGIVAFLAALALFLPRFGLACIGPAYILMYVVQLTIVLLLVRRRVASRPPLAVVKRAGAYASLILAILVVASASATWAVVFGGAVTVAVAVEGLHCLMRLGGLGGPGARIAEFARSLRRRA